MSKRHFRSFIGGTATGAGLLVGGMSIARSSATNDCMNRPLGNCWVENGHGLTWVIELLGKTGLTPLMSIVFFLAVILLLAFIYFGAVSSNRDHPGMSFARGIVTGLILGFGILLFW